jgi:hypothetical protein
MFLGLSGLIVTVVCDLVVAVRAEVARDAMIVREIPPLTLIPVELTR